MRLFTAINLSRRSRQLLTDKIEILKETLDQDLKWVDPENWHITLKFLGDTRSNKVEKIKDDIKQVASSRERFPIILNQLGAFPHINHPKVIYVGVKKGAKRLSQLQKNLEEKLVKRGFSPEDREYTPHLTIARPRKSNDFKILSNKLKKFVDKNHFVNIYFKADRISLMESQLTPDGPIYKEKFSKKLE